MVYCKLIRSKRKSGKKAKRKHPKRGRKSKRGHKKAKKGGLRRCVRKAKSLKAAKKCLRKY